MEGWAGFEPAPQGFADLRISLFATIPLAEEEGFEPPNDRIKTCCLTVWPLPNLAEGEGFEPVGASRHAGFQDQCNKPDSANLP